jgi:hypothetical protein
MMCDRSDDDALPISQNLLAEMLGVQRPTITNAARDLERGGLITRGRQQITIRDRKGLMEASCECYQISASTHHLSSPKNMHDCFVTSVMYITDSVLHPIVMFGWQSFGPCSKFRPRIRFHWR